MKSVAEERAARLHTELHRVEHRVHALKADDPGLLVDQAVCNLMQERPTEFKDYSVALAHVLKSDEDLASRYAASFGHNEKVSPRQAREFGMDDEDDDGKPGAAGRRIDALVEALMRSQAGLDYEKALGKVRASHPELFKKYAAEKG
jgi:hypothetical protein